MTTIAIKDEYAEILSNFGDLNQAVHVALQRYTIEQIATKITELKQQDLAYQTKYDTDYPTFTHRIAEDEAYIQHVEREVNKLWELDLADWEFCHQGIEDWTRKLEPLII